MTSRVGCKKCDRSATGGMKLSVIGSMKRVEKMGRVGGHGRLHGLLECILAIGVN